MDEFLIVALCSDVCILSEVSIQHKHRMGYISKMFYIILCVWAHPHLVKARVNMRAHLLHGDTDKGKLGKYRFIAQGFAPVLCSVSLKLYACDLKIFHSKIFVVAEDGKF